MKVLVSNLIFLYFSCTTDLYASRYHATATQKSKRRALILINLKIHTLIIQPNYPFSSNPCLFIHPKSNTNLFCFLLIANGII